MPRRICTGALAALFSLSLVTSAHALERQKGQAGESFQGPPAAAALAYVESSREALSLRGVALEVDRVLPFGNAFTVRLVQRHGGLRVLDASASVVLTDGGEVVSSTLNVARGLTVSTVPSLGADEARKAAERAAGRPLELSRSPSLGVIADDERGGRLVYELDAFGPRGGERLRIDAHTGELAGRRDLVLHAKGRVYKISSANTPKPSDEDLLDLDALTPQRLDAFASGLDVFEYASGSSQTGKYEVTQVTGPTEGADFLYDPPKNATDQHDAFAVVNAFYHVHRMRGFFTQTFKLDMTPSSWDLGVIANGLDDGEPMDNAFFSPMGLPSKGKPNLIVIGQGHYDDFAYDSDVFLHEFTHYVSQNAINYNEGQFGSDSYGLSPFGGAIDEGIADYFACTVNGDPVLGEASLAPLGAERDLSISDKTCPDSLFGEVHEDGKIIGSAAWAIHELLGKAKGDQVVWGGFSQLHKGTSLGDFATAVTDAAEAQAKAGVLTSAEVDGVKKIFADSGLDDCGHVLSLNKAPRTTTMFGLNLLAAQQGGGSCSDFKQYGLELSSLFHFSWKPSDGATAARFRVDLSPAGGGGFGGGGDKTLDWGIYVKANKHPSFSNGPGGFPKLSKYDYAVENLTDKTGELVIDASSDPPFDPTATYYMVIVHKNCPSRTAKVSAEDYTPGEGTGGAGGSGGQAGSSGKGGAAGGSPSAVAGGASGAATAVGSGAGSGGAAGVQGGPALDATADDVGGGCSLPSGTTPRSGALAALALGLVAALRRRRPRA